jgi:hypothetical protein
MKKFDGSGVFFYFGGATVFLDSIKKKRERKKRKERRLNKKQNIEQNARILQIPISKARQTAFWVAKDKSWGCGYMG